MKTHHRRMLLAAMLATAGIAATAQTATPQPGAPAPDRPGMMDREGHRGMDPARMRERMQQRVQRRLEDLKIRLQLTPAQEGAWQQFAQSMQPPAQLPQRPDPAAFERMTTPERIDRLRALRNARNAEMDRRAEAAKAFYAQLNPSQKRVFDLESARMMRPHGGHHGMGMARMEREHHDGGRGEPERR